MDRLPTELLHNIVRILAEDNKNTKNVLLEPRCVCKAFDAAIKPYVLKTLQLDFGRFVDPRSHAPSQVLQKAGTLCQALYCDVSIIRDEDEMDLWNRLFGAAAKRDTSITGFLNGFSQFCMGAYEFDEHVFKSLLNDVLSQTPNLKRIRLNLPVLMLGRRSSATTILLAMAFACLTQRPEEFQCIETLVLDHVADETITSICRNPIDLGHARLAFKHLRNLSISFKRTSDFVDASPWFTGDFWFLLSYAEMLDTLSITGWHNTPTARINIAWVTFPSWRPDCLRYTDVERRFGNLRCLELKNVRVWPHDLLAFVKDHQSSLKEIYLIDVLMKVNTTDTTDVGQHNLWVGHGPERSDLKLPAGGVWLASSFACLQGLKLEVLRATGLGYDIFPGSVEQWNKKNDLVDPSGKDRSIDQRFVEIAMGVAQPSESLDQNEADIIESYFDLQTGLLITPVHERVAASADPSCYDVRAYRKLHHNTTSSWKYSIDGTFHNHSRDTKQKLRELIGITDKCFKFASEDISRIHRSETLNAFST